MDSGTIESLRDIWGSSGSDIFAVERYGTILHYPTTPHKPVTCLSVLLFGEHSEETEFLRSIRDTILSKTPEGREIIKLYY